MKAQADFRLATQNDLADQIVDRIQQMVIDGELSDGQVLPAEADLAALMGVSRTALREAKRTLAERGMLETRQGVGTIVRSVDADSVARSLRLYTQLRSGGVDFEQFHPVRILLEIEISGLAAANATDETIHRLQQLMDAMRASVDDHRRFARADVAFHQHLAVMSNNSLLELLAAVIRDLLERHIDEVVRRIDPTVNVLPYHGTILEAVAARDRGRARAAMESHLQQVRLNYVEASEVAAKAGRTSRHRQGVDA